MKIYIMIFAAISAAIFFTFIMGKKLEQAKCRADLSESAMIQLNKIQETKRKINEETLSTGISDVRLWLRKNYTIAE